MKSKRKAKTPFQELDNELDTLGSWAALTKRQIDAAMKSMADDIGYGLWGGIAYGSALPKGAKKELINRLKSLSKAEKALLGIE